jgi:hypothetical protein
MQMNPLRQIIGLLILVFFGIPSLFGIIWAVGLTRAAVSPELLSDLPQEVIAEVPYFIDDVFNAAQKEDNITDENTREWILAAAKVGKTPRELLTEIGFLDWLKNNLSVSLKELGEILRGETRLKSIWLDLRPLKKVIMHESVESYYFSVIKNLPPCTESDMDRWQTIAVHDYYDDDNGLPACQPDPEMARQALKTIRSEIIEDMPDEVDIIERDHDFPRGINISRFVVSLTYLLFLIPAAFILVGSLVAASSKSSFFRWSGVSTGIAGILALALSLFAKNISTFAVDAIPFHYSDEVSLEMQEVIFDNLGGIFGVVFEKLFSPVVTVAGIVCIVGVVLFALSYAFPYENNDRDRVESVKSDT